MIKIIEEMSYTGEKEEDFFEMRETDFDNEIDANLYFLKISHQDETSDRPSRVKMLDENGNIIKEKRNY